MKRPKEIMSRYECLRVSKVFGGIANPKVLINGGGMGTKEHDDAQCYDASFSFDAS